MARNFDTLTHKEKQALRLLVRGHDAKTAASELGLSVHTINERLRAARRKLDVTSSKEAARLLFENEQGTDKKSVSKDLGDVHFPSLSNPPDRAGLKPRTLLIGGIVMSVSFSLVLVLSLAISQPSAAPSAGQGAPKTTTASEYSANERERLKAASDWLALVDKDDWAGSYAAASREFQRPNTVASWQAASKQVHDTYGAVVSRSFIMSEAIPSPEGYVVVRFRAEFEKRPGITEHITLVREEGELRVIGYFLS